MQKRQPIFDRRPYCDPAEWAQRYRYMKTTASMFSFEQSPYFELPNQVMAQRPIAVFSTLTYFSLMPRWNKAPMALPMMMATALMMIAYIFG